MTMKKTFTISLLFIIILFVISCKPQPINQIVNIGLGSSTSCGCIKGVVADRFTGNPVLNANVTLQPIGTSCNTDAVGRYEFLNLEADNYFISVSKVGYSSYIDNDIIMIANDTITKDILIEKLPSVIRILDDEGNDIDIIDFGYNNDISRMFSIFNDGENIIEYNIQKTVSWITDINPVADTLLPGDLKSIIITINRDMLSQGENTTKIYVISNCGSKEITVKVYKH